MSAAEAATQVATTKAAAKAAGDMAAAAETATMATATSAAAREAVRGNEPGGKSGNCCRDDHHLAQHDMLLRTRVVRPFAEYSRSPPAVATASIRSMIRKRDLMRSVGVAWAILLALVVSCANPARGTPGCFTPARIGLGMPRANASSLYGSGLSRGGGDSRRRGARHD
jgi:hypothetical protein